MDDGKINDDTLGVVLRDGRGKIDVSGFKLSCIIISRKSTIPGYGCLIAILGVHIVFFYLLRIIAIAVLTIDILLVVLRDKPRRELRCDYKVCNVRNEIGKCLVKYRVPVELNVLQGGFVPAHWIILASGQNPGRHIE